MNIENSITASNITNQIFTIRNEQVMIDSDLAELYNVSTGRLNEQVKRNAARFPDDFMFRLTTDEWENLKSQNATSSWGGRRKLPFVFTEQGVSSLSSVLKSEIAIKVHVEIMRAFVGMRKFITNNAAIFQRLNNVEQKQLETNDKFEQIFKALEDKSIKPKQGIFYNGQIFDAYLFISDLIKNATKSIVLIDNYIDETVLILFSKNQHINVTIHTHNISRQLKLDLEKYNTQYRPIEIKKFNKSHDRFMIIDGKETYHFGASLKDLGKKWFAFSKFDIDAIELLKKLH